MGIKLNILFIALLIHAAGFTEEKFLSIKGVVLEEETKTEMTGYSIKLVQDKLDSNSVDFSKPEFQVWAPANRRTIVYFSKPGYVTKQVYIDASYIPSIAFKEKQQIELEIFMTPVEKTGKRNFSKPIITAAYDARSNAFTVKEEDVSTNGNNSAAKLDANYLPPFPAPVDTYKAVQPTANDLGLTQSFNKEKTKAGAELTKFIQGILFADLNYCFFNERTNDANVILATLAEIDPVVWGALKPFDSPEYGKIVMRTMNREQSADTLFALGACIETSRLIFLNFTSETKIIVHLKKMREIISSWQPTDLTQKQSEMVDALRNLIPLIEELESRYTENLRNKVEFDLQTDASFQSIQQANQTIYQSLIE
ncbi:MAG: hypothetical protein IPM74_13735 [Crocinitomicaceae bacterium]|nr:hypothetical protein [Crocinitomicaceae bacterium]MBK8926936.1 hypothetical protein [Crocinitomicaceae bacterium]